MYISYYMPQNVKEFRAILGLVKYYDKFLPNLSTGHQTIARIMRENSEMSLDNRMQPSIWKCKIIDRVRICFTH